MRQTHRAQRGQDDYAKQSPRIWTEPRCKTSIDCRVSIGWESGQLLYRCHQTSLRIQHGNDDCHDAEEHDDALDEVVHRRCFVASEDDIDGCKGCHTDDAILVWNAEAHLEETRNAAINTGCIGNQEHESDDAGHDTQVLTAVARAKEVGHSATLDVLRHQFGALSQQKPGKQRADYSIANAYPSAGKAVSPAELPCITDKDDSREITRSVSKCSEPRTNGTPAKNEAVN